MIIQNTSKSLGDFFNDTKEGFILWPDGKIEDKHNSLVGRYDIASYNEWLDFRTSASAWAKYGKTIKKVVEEYEKFSGLQVFIKIS